MFLPLSLLLGCASTPSGDDTGGAAPDAEAFIPPDRVGPYEAATLESAFVPEHGVELAVQVWYPSRHPGEPHRYDQVLQATAGDGGPAACDIPRPVVVFSHGNSGVRWQSVFFTERLATRGWIVVAPDHTHNTALDYDASKLGEVLFRRPVDIAAAFDWLVEELAGPGGALEGCVDPDDGYAVAGHSFGGYTALAVAGAIVDPETVLPYCTSTRDWLCAEVEAHFQREPVRPVDLSDGRVWASVPMTPAGMGALAGGLGGVAVPVLMWGGGRDTLTSMADSVLPLFSGLAHEPRHLATVVDAGHYTFSDACTFLPTSDDCTPPHRPPDEVHRLVNTMTTAFLDRHRGFEQSARWLPVEDAGMEWESYE
ncbi:MAG: hypothetical protein VX265_03840 [Myxococcota bacterium]|nr:hypothetical protein [Myxococcota bacterium]